MGIKIVYAYNQAEEVGKLFTEYTDMLIENDSSFKEYLEIQNYSEEMEHLESKYGLPDGRLYLAYCDEELAGCIALFKKGGVSNNMCEYPIFFASFMIFSTSRLPIFCPLNFGLT